MTERVIKTPNADHPITIEKNPSHVRVMLGGRVLADSQNALRLKEAKYPTIQYIPRSDVDMTALSRTEHTTYCPYKGDCSYYSIAAGGERGVNAVWTYEAAFPAAEAITNHLAFYPDRVEITEAE